MPELPTGTVTFLFSDIEGSTGLMQALGRQFPLLLERHNELLRSCWAKHGGIEVSTEGDAFFVVFDNAARAVAAAVCAQEMISAEPWRDEGAVRVRIGLHTGQGELGADNYVGMDVNRAARIAAAAHGGQVLVSQATAILAARALPTRVRLRDLGMHRLKGLPEDERIYQLVIADISDVFPAIRSLEPRPTNLPAPTTELFGREAELQRVSELLEVARLVTLTGPGGTGKSSLALAVAHSVRDRFPDGVFVTWLASVSDPALVASAIGAPLGVQESGDRPVAETLLEHLRDRKMLLVLDNFEQVMGAVSYVRRILDSAVGLRLIVTSQQVLRLTAEQAFEVAPLPVPDESADLPGLLDNPAVRLFEERVRALRPDFRVSLADARVVAALIARLDGLPLAVELAAARMQVLTPAAFLARLDRGLALLSGGGTDRPLRHQTMRATLDWSYELLNPGARELLARLSVFRGGFTLEAVEAVASVDPALASDAMDDLTALVEHSLVRRSDVAGEPYFTLLETIREYGSERLSATGRADAVAATHAHHFREFAESLRGAVTASDGAARMAQLERDNDNLRAALRWALDHEPPDAALQLVSALWRFWHLRGYLVEAREWSAEALRADGPRSPATYARALIADGSLAYWQADVETAAARYGSALEYARRSADDAVLGEALFNQAFMLSGDGRSQEALALLSEAEGRFVRVGDEDGLGRVAFGRCFATAMLGRVEEAIERADQAIATFRLTDNLYWEGTAYHALGQCFRLSVHPAEAELAYSNALARLARLGDRSGIAVELDMLAVVAAELADPHRSLRLAGAAAAIRDAIGAGQLLAMQFYRDPVELIAGQVPAAEVNDLMAEGASWSVPAAIEYATARTAASASIDASAVTGSSHRLLS
ncbi:MAG: adenylate/guanylate cyclase domain-containing protein [Chloroflexota bacterium]|nr:adenylate/guanylate cyclase domain-containing protein [Chloroflexota bacterium]